LVLEGAKSLSFKGYEFTDLRSQSLGNFSRVAKANDSTNEDVLQAYSSANEDAFRAQRQMYGFIKAAEAAGLKRPQIIAALKRDSNLGTEELGYLLKGQFRPVTLSDKTFRDVYAETAVKGEPRKIAKLPAKELLAIAREYNKRPLVAESVTQETAPQTISLEPSGETAPQTISLEPVAATTPPPVAAQAGAAPAPSAVPAPTTQKRPAALMGSNPFDAMKNMLTFGD